MADGSIDAEAHTSCAEVDSCTTGGRPQDICMRARTVPCLRGSSDSERRYRLSYVARFGGARKTSVALRKRTRACGGWEQGDLD